MYNFSVTQCFLSLASNFRAEQNLALAYTILIPNPKDIVARKTSENSTSSTASEFDEANMIFGKGIIQPLEDYTNIQIQAAEYSPVILSQDKDKPSPLSTHLGSVYHNQVVWLSFGSAITWEKLHGFTKSVERTALRHEFTKPIVSLDVDILAICTNKPLSANNPRDNSDIMLLLSSPLSYLHKPVQKSPYTWYGITRRFPLANYDRYGINHLLSQQFARNLPFLSIL